jgi:hypothetical protein
VLGQRGIRCGGNLHQQRRFLLWPYPAVAARAAASDERTGLTLLGAPALDRTDIDAKEAGRLDLWQPSVNGSQQPLAEVGGVLLHEPSIPKAQLFRNPL